MKYVTAYCFRRNKEHMGQSCAMHEDIITMVKNVHEPFLVVQKDCKYNGVL